MHHMLFNGTAAWQLMMQTQLDQEWGTQFDIQDVPFSRPQKSKQKLLDQQWKQKL
jgi:hypothetical protein